MVLTHKYILIQLAVAFVAQVVNARERRLLLALVRLANAVRRPFRTRVVLTVVPLAEQRHERLCEAASLLRRIRVWEDEASEVFGPADAGESALAPRGWSLAETSIGEADAPDQLPTMPAQPVVMPAACQTTERRSKAATTRREAERKPRSIDPDREEKLAEAEAMVHKQGGSVRAAARRCGVAESTLRKRLKRRRG